LHIHYQDPYCAGGSILHGLDARVKFVLTLAFILITAATPVGAWPVYILLFALVLSAAIASELGATYAIRRAAYALLFVLAALPTMVTTPGPALLVVRLGRGSLVLTAPGVERFVSILLKSWISVQAAALLVATTPFTDLLTAMRALRVPRLLVAIFGLMWRYLFVLADEALRMTRAREARSADPNGRGGGTLVWRAQVTGAMVGSIFLRGYERSERIYAAMLARGYDGEMRALSQPPLTARQILILVAGIATLAALGGLGIIFW